MASLGWSMAGLSGNVFLLTSAPHCGRTAFLLTEPEGFSAGSDGKEAAVQETWVPSLGREDPLEEDMATHSSILAWRIPMDRGAWWAAVRGVSKIWI